MSTVPKTSEALSRTAPTMRTAAWAVTDFLAAAERVCEADKQSRQVRLYFYAATESGWRRLRKSILNWCKARGDRAVTAYIGTDHALTDAAALELMQSEGIEVRLMRHYTGIFHPKVIWFVRKTGGTILAGSNNLTEDGLRNNVEFATVTTLAQVDANMQTWHDEIHKASEPATAALIKSYAKEKEKYGQRRAASGQGGDFTWSKRTSGASGQEVQCQDHGGWRVGWFQVNPRSHAAGDQRGGAAGSDTVGRRAKILRAGQYDRKKHQARAE